MKASYLSPKSHRYIMNVIVPKVQDHLTDDLLRAPYKKMPNRKKLTGFCYVASETVWYQLTEHQRELLQPHYMRVNGMIHWLLKSKQLNIVVDPTAGQYDEPLNYDNAIKCAFLTKKPSKRTAILLKRMGYL